MNTCKSCKFWVTKPITPVDYVDPPKGFGQCAAAHVDNDGNSGDKKDFDISKMLIPIVSEWTIAICTRQDFGCIKHEQAVA